MREAVQVERLVLAEGIDHHGGGIGQEDHVGLVDLLEAADGRAVEAVSFGEHLLRQRVRREGEMLHEAGKIRPGSTTTSIPSSFTSRTTSAGLRSFMVTSPSEISSSSHLVHARANGCWSAPIHRACSKCAAGRPSSSSLHNGTRRR